MGIMDDEGRGWGEEEGEGEEEEEDDDDDDVVENGREEGPRRRGREERVAERRAIKAGLNFVSIITQQTSVAGLLA